MMTLATVFYWIIAHWRALAVVAGLIAVLAIVAGVNRSCERRRASEALRRADESANRSLILKGERDALRREVNADLDTLETERQKRNENTNALLRDLGLDCRIARDCVTGAELDRQADEFRRRHANANANANAGRR